MSPSTARTALLAFAGLIVSIDYNIVYVALPDIGRQLDFSAQSLQWVVSAYAVGLGGFLLLGGRAVDRLGARRMFLAALGLYAGSSLAGGLTTEAGPLLAARAVQGAGGALLLPATLALISTTFIAGPQRNRALAAWGVAGSSGVLVGGAAGGVLTGYLGWQWVFFVNVPLALLAALAAVRVLPADAAPAPVAGAGFDVPGALVATAGATLSVFGVVSGPEAGWASIRGGGTVALGALLLGLFVLIEGRTRDPLVPPRMVGYRPLVTAIAIIFVLMGPINLLHYVFFVHVQDVLGYPPLQAGLAFLPTSVFAMLGSGKLLPLLLNRWGLGPALLISVAGAGGSMAVLAAGLSATGSYWAMLPGLMFWGLFAGTAFPLVFVAAGTGVPGAEQGVASALTSTAQQLGGAVGLAALVAVANASGSLGSSATPAPSDLVDGLQTAVWVGSLVAAASAVLALRLPPWSRSGLPRTEPPVASAPVGSAPVGSAPVGSAPAGQEAPGTPVAC